MGWGWIAALAAVALFYALLKRRKAKPTPPPMHRPFALPDWMNDPVRPEPRRSTPNPAQRLPGTFRMAYVDVNGEETVRDIETQRPNASVGNSTSRRGATCATTDARSARIASAGWRPTPARECLIP